MKVEIKLTSDQVFYLEKKLQTISAIKPAEFVRLSKDEKVKNSLLMDCYDKIESKSNTISRKPTIFDQDKKYSISFKYHEASILNMLCCSLKDIEEAQSHYQIMALSIFLKLDEKL